MAVFLLQCVTADELKVFSSTRTKARSNFKFNPVLSYYTIKHRLMKFWTYESIISCIHVYLRGLALKMPAERPIKNSDRKKKSDFKSSTSRDKIMYKAEKIEVNPLSSFHF